jgi:hypothetical protein
MKTRIVEIVATDSLLEHNYTIDKDSLGVLVDAVLASYGALYYYNGSITFLSTFNTTIDGDTLVLLDRTNITNWIRIQNKTFDLDFQVPNTNQLDLDWISFLSGIPKNRLLGDETVRSVEYNAILDNFWDSCQTIIEFLKKNNILNDVVHSEPVQLYTNNEKYNELIRAFITQKITHQVDQVELSSEDAE